MFLCLFKCDLVGVVGLACLVEFLFDLFVDCWICWLLFLLGGLYCLLELICEFNSID